VRAVDRRDQPARRRHDEGFSRERRDVHQIRGAHRLQEGFDNRRDHALVLAELRADFVRADDVGRVMRAERIGDRLLVARVQIGVQQADRDRVDCVGDGRDATVERRELATATVEAARHVEPKRARNERLGSVDKRVIERRTRLACDLDYVAEPFGRDERDARTASFEQRVRCNRRAVREDRDGFVAGHRAPGTGNRESRIIRTRRDLGDSAVVRDDIGEGPAAVDAEPHARTLAL
jgi:hypothetical protein